MHEPWTVIFIVSHCQVSGRLDNSFSIHSLEQGLSCLGHLIACEIAQSPWPEGAPRSLPVEAPALAVSGGCTVASPTALSALGLAWDARAPKTLSHSRSRIIRDVQSKLTSPLSSHLSHPPASTFLSPFLPSSPAPDRLLPRRPSLLPPPPPRRPPPTMRSAELST